MLLRSASFADNNLVYDYVANAQHLLLVWLWRVCLRMDDHRTHDHCHWSNAVSHGRNGGSVPAIGGHWQWQWHWQNAVSLVDRLSLWLYSSDKLKAIFIYSQINCVFLINIIRILITKLRLTMTVEMAQIRFAYNGLKSLTISYNRADESLEIPAEIPTNSSAHKPIP